MMSELYKELYKNEYAMEAFNEMRLAQPPKDRMHYFDIVLEGSAEQNASLLQKLYSDIIAKSNIDFGTIPDSKGNLQKYSDYKVMEESIDRINQLFEGQACDEVKLMNSVHDMIISCRKDYEFGYSYDIEILKIMYCTSVMTLHELITLCITVYTDGMKSKTGTFNFSKKKRDQLIVVKSAKALLKSYNNGQFAKVVQAFRKDPHMLDSSGPATEAGGTVQVNASFSNGHNLLTGESIGKTFTAMKDFVVNDVPRFISIPIAIVVALIVIWLVIRKLIYLFYCGAVRVRDYVNTEKEVLDIAIRNEKDEGASDKVVKKHSKLAERLQKIATFIEIRILNNDKKATEELSRSNKENFNSVDFRSQAVGADMEF